ncbi:MAG: phosphorylase superfamily protein [Candidatus Accumulibacter regalis]|jgi:Phosphorylase superfamily.
MDTIDVLIVAALKLEFDAAHDAGLSTRGRSTGIKRWEQKGEDSDSPYLLGTYETGSLPLRIALAYSSRMGGRSVATLAAKLVERLKPKCLAMSGVCAGNPAELNIGDVVFAEMAYEYDEGKQKADEFEPDHRQILALNSWVNAALRMRVDDLPSFGKPSNEERRLWLLERLLAGQDPKKHAAFLRYFPGSRWQRCVDSYSEEGLIVRGVDSVHLTQHGRDTANTNLYFHSLPPKRLPFQLKVGPIASGSAVIKDGVTWESLKRWGVRTVVGLEMEAASVATVAEQADKLLWVVVKGVMDYANPLKDDRYKPFAARASAEVLYRFLSSQVEDIARRRPSVPAVQVSYAVPAYDRGEKRRRMPSAVTMEEKGPWTYLRNQTESLLNKSLLPWTKGGAGAFRLLWPELVVPARVQDLKTLTVQTLRDWLEGHPRPPCTFIIGGPGIGKSTAVRYIFLELADAFLHKKGTTIPFLLHASDLVHSRKETLALAERLSQCGEALVTIVDGLDEVTLADSHNIASECLPTLGEYGTWITTSRDGHYHSHVSAIPGLDESISSLLELQPWSLEDSSAFARGYFQRVGYPDAEQERFVSAITRDPLRGFTENPFQLLLLMYLFISGERLSEVIDNRFGLYSAFYQHWIARELRRGAGELKFNIGEAVVLAHEKLALGAYTKRHSYPFGRVYEALEVDECVRTHPAFAGLLVDAASPLDLKVVKAGFQHQSFLEFLVARTVLSAVMGTSDKVPSVLGEELNVEINAFIRGAFSNLGDGESARIARRARRFYDVLLARCDESSGDGLPRTLEQARSLRAREQIVYFLGRMNGPEATRAVAYVYHADPHRLVRRTAALGAILHGVEDVESEYVARLTEHPAENLLNRSTQLVYFGDVTESIFEFEDDGQLAWHRTRAATFERIGMGDVRSRRLRWWDLATVWSFVSSRGGSLSAEERRTLESSRNEFEPHAGVRSTSALRILDSLLGTPAAATVL